MPDEEAYLDSIIASFEKQMRELWKPGGFERGGNTKTHGIVRGEFIVHDDLPENLRHGIYAQPHTYRAWVRFSGPGPYITPDIDDVGFMSISIKLMGVPGPKLMDEEKFTQDMFGVSTPTFVTPDTKANAQLQIESVKNAPIFYFLNFHRPHVLDFIMQSLWIKTQSSPFEAPYFSCVPYLLGEGQAMQYSVWPKIEETNADTAASSSSARRLSARRDGRIACRRRMSNSTFACSCRPIRTSCPSRTTPCSGPRGFLRAYRWPRCAFRGRNSTRRRKWSSPNGSRTIRGIASPSIARWATRAAPDGGCMASFRSCGIR